MKSLLTIFFAFCLVKSYGQTDSLLQRLIDSAKAQQQVTNPEDISKDTPSVVVNINPIKKDTTKTVTPGNANFNDISSDSLATNRSLRATSLPHSSGVDSLPGDSVITPALVIGNGSIKWQEDTAFMQLLKPPVSNKRIPTSTLRDGDVHITQRKDNLFYVLVGVVLLLALVRQLFPKYFLNVSHLMFQASFRQKQTREILMQEKLPSLILNILFILVSGLFLALISETYKTESYRWLNASFWKISMYSISFLALLYLFKYIIIQFIGWIFNATEEASTYSFIVFLINKLIGIALLPLLFLVAFSSGHTWEITVTIGGFVVLLLLLFRYIVSLTIIRSALSIHPLHFFIYLCSIELMPMLIIYKVLISYIGKSN